VELFFPDAVIEHRPVDEPVLPNARGTQACGCDADHRALFVCQEAPL